MASYRKATNEMVTCPFDPAHRMLKSRLQMHIAKCKLNHLDKDMEVCPFNATHRFARGLLNDHLTKCPDRMPLDKMLSANMDKNNIFKGRTAVPSYHQPVPPCEEVWDTTVMPSAGYTPQIAPPRDGIVLDLGLMKPAERKHFYRSLHSMGSNDKNDTEDKPKHTKEPLRQPKEKVETLIQKNVLQNSPNVGVGRGQVKADSRIAADIFGGETSRQPIRQPKSYRQVVAGMNTLNLGMGRGRVHSYAANEKLDTEEYQENFPALGLGRGVPIPPKENNTTGSSFSNNANIEN